MPEHLLLGTFCTAFLNGSRTSAMQDQQTEQSIHLMDQIFSLDIMRIFKLVLRFPSRTSRVSMRETLYQIHSIFLSAPAFPKEVRDSGKFLSTTRQGISL